ncbi:MAG: glycoside hydrolase family 30 beta sandwich domain-containing protein [Bacteroidota bacterium]
MKVNHFVLWWSPCLLSLLILSCQPTSEPEEPAEPEPISVALQLDSSVQYETIEGFGGFGAQNTWWSQGPFYDEAFLDLLLNDLGVTILRDNIPISFEPQNDNEDPETLAIENFNLSTISPPSADSHLGQHFPYLKAMHEAGLEKLIATVWSPPIWMKHNDHRGNGTNDQNSAPPYTDAPDATTNQLRMDHYEEFAEYCVAYVHLLKQETGIDLYALSVQNEPRFSQFYASCVHSPESLRDLIKVVGSRFEQEGIETKLFAPEDVQSMWHIRQYLDAILQDSLANRYTDIFAIHNYRDNGIDPSDEGPQNWQETYEKAQQGNKQVWMTETSGFNPNTIYGGLDLATSMFNAFHYGQASAWVYWQMSESFDNGLISQGQPTFLYHVSKHFYRHIRPGAVRIRVEEAEEDLLALAFQLEDEKMGLILINLGEEPLEISLSGTGGGAFQTFVTTAQQFHAEQATATDGLNLPPASIATLIQ